MVCLPLVGRGSRTNIGGSGIWVACHRSTDPSGDLVRVVASLACQWCSVFHVITMRLLLFIDGLVYITYPKSFDELPSLPTKLKT